MFTRKLTFAAVLTFAGLLVAQPAMAQNSVTGAIAGRADERDTGAPAAGVAVVATSPSLQGSQSALTDEGGQYKITNLPPGTYTVNFYYLESTTTRNAIAVDVNKTTFVNAKVGGAASKGKTIVVEQKAPTVDTTKTDKGVTLTQDYTQNIPIPGRTFESALGAAPGSSGDGLGVSFSGSSSLENQYIVDGVNTTNLTFGTVGSALINDFIEQIEIITGGYNAEYGRATGGVVNVVTKSGSNEFKGQVFGYYSPGFLAAAPKRTPRDSFAMDFTSGLNYDLDFGFDLGGPIIKDKVWFYVGFAPRIQTADITTITKSRTDCRSVLPDGSLSECNPALENMGGFADGVADEDPATGFLVFDDLCGGENQPACETEVARTQIFQFLSKVNFAVSPEHQGQISFVGTPATGKSVGVFGEKQAVNTNFQTLTSDLSTKWTSKFNNNKTEVEAVLGWHRDTFDRGSVNGPADALPRQVLIFGNLGTWARRPEEADYTRAGCADSAGGGDRYPFIENCPDVGVGYSTGGPGSLFDDVEQRISARLAGTQRVKLAGNHEIKAGADLENNSISFLREFSGGVYYLNDLQSSRIYTTRWVQVAPPGFANDPNAGGFIYDDTCGDDPLTGEETRCAWMDRDRVKSTTLNWSAYLRDSWQVLPNLTLNYGLRYEEQRLRYRDDLQNTRDPFTGNIRGKNAMVLNNMWAPRVGVIYDWTKENRSKVYGHWGRFYDNIPLRINERSFGGEATLRQIYDGGQCGDTIDNIGGPDGNNCPTDVAPGVEPGDLQGGAGILIQPGIRPQFMDEFIFGVEYEVLEDLKLGLSYQNRRIGRVLEDLSTDNAVTYVLANPGEWSSAEERKLENKIASLEGQAAGAPCMPDVDLGSPACEAQRLRSDLEQYKGIAEFDKPTRDYHAVEFTATKRFSKNFFAQFAYTYSILQGNYPGKFSADTGQVDPNITSQFDLIELLANRTGRLPNDRPHYFKLDGYYQFDFKEAGTLLTGVRYRALSGTPVDALGAHYFYGFGESYLLPRGEMGRVDFDQGLDLKVVYGRKLTKGIEMAFFVDLFSIFNTQGIFSLDEDYTFDNANPVVGGEYRDLIFLKQQTDEGLETNVPVRRNRNFGNPAGRYSPFEARVGMRLTF